MIAALLACAGEPSAPDARDDSGPAWVLGDPIETLGGATATGLAEFSDAAMLPDGRGLVVGVDGWGLVSAEGELLHQEEGLGLPGKRVAVDGDTAWVATRTAGLYRLDLGREAPTLAGQVSASPHRDLAVEEGVLVLALGSEGLQWLDEEGRIEAELDADSHAVAIEGGRTLYGDGTRLVLEDRSVELGAVPRAIDWDGEVAAVALGGSGTVLVDTDAMALLHRVEHPGAAFSVALDGDAAWIAAWTVTVLVDVPTGEVLGHESPRVSAMGLDAADGRAIVADWNEVSALERQPGRAGPELHPPRNLWTGNGDASALRLVNWGTTAELETTWTVAAGEVELDGERLVLGPGEEGTLHLVGDGDATLAFTSNDPDEPHGELEVYASNVLFGEHSDFELLGFPDPDAELRPYQLSEQRGRPVLLVFWEMGCPVCSDEVPDVATTYAEPFPELVVWLVNAGDDEPSARSFLAQGGVELDCLLDEERSISRAYGLVPGRFASWPQQVLIDGEGRVVHIQTTYDADAMTAAIEALLSR